ncbi:DUF2971 domain-containing protein [Enterobacter hormaechei subsp. steigerwaltii]|nr:DUF2971 domain-containing protein [Enterobacter hormaechei subsp. steigerwaltii]
MLYKYVGNVDANKAVEYLKAFVENGTIYSSRPFDFNDPAELKVRFDFEANFELIKKRFKRDRPNETEQGFYNWYNSFNDHAKWWVAYNTREQCLSSDGIVCLTREYDNFLMWSHYAHSHTGFCIGFNDEFVKTIDDRGFEGDVKYVRSYPRFNYFLDQEVDYLSAVYLHKGEPWAYEKEFRVITKSHGIKNFDNSHIKEIILGCRASQVLVDYSFELLDKGIAVYKMAISEDTYQLRKIPVLKNHYFQGDV